MLFEFNAISKALEFNIPLGVLDKINNRREQAKYCEYFKKKKN